MQPPPSPMDVDSPGAKGKNKRTAEDVSPTTTPQDTSPDADTAPRILRRHQHRRRNVAAEVWGPDIPFTPAASPNPSTAAGVAPKPPLNIYKSLLRHPNLFFQFALRLPYPTIIDLYAIDKEFHYRLNKYSVSLMHDYARYHAPLAGYIFSWVLYPELCISDPMLRPMDGRSWLARDVPGFRWIGMILWREKVVRRILTLLGIEGHRVPRSSPAALMKFWCLMEMRTTPLRHSFLRDARIWSNGDIALVQLVLLKLDMRFGDPVLGNGAAGLAHLLLSQKSLSMLWKVLAGMVTLDYDNTTDLVVRTYPTDDLDTETHPWLDDEIDNGVPDNEWGILCKEEWNAEGARMETAVDMVVLEGGRRGLHIQGLYLDFLLYGAVDPGSGRNIPVPRLLRGGKGAQVPAEGWPGHGVRKRMIRGLDERLGVGGKREREVEAMDTST